MNHNRNRKLSIMLIWSLVLESF
uniref:Uncharacterized protein n=1 Tax=Arundo donax TaxID=35708 RepID=A0A0A9BVT7_ARUDO